MALASSPYRSLKSSSRATLPALEGATEKLTQLVPVGGVDDGYPEAFYGLDLNGNIWYGEVIPGAPMAIRWGRVNEEHD